MTVFFVHCRCKGVLRGFAYLCHAAVISQHYLILWALEYMMSCRIGDE